MTIHLEHREQGMLTFSEVIPIVLGLYTRSMERKLSGCKRNTYSIVTIHLEHGEQGMFTCFDVKGILLVL